MKSGKMVILVAVSLLAGGLFAEDGENFGKRGIVRGPHGMKGRIMGRIRKHIAKSLDLTEEQKEQAKEIREANKEKMKNLAEAVHEARKAVRDASMADEVDENAIRELAKHAGEAMAEMAILRSQMKKEFESILTDEQKAKLEEKKAEMKERMKKMRKRFQAGKDRDRKSQFEKKKECDK